uniref:Cation-transporting P-type ATPase N-terminal domain-containing protein n=1 Tax=Esox lucius TaxID=8010 RepID=A0AAY5KDT1_ESOLU
STGSPAQEEPPTGLCSPSPKKEPHRKPQTHMDVQGFKWVRWRVWLCRIGALLSLGLLLMLFHWNPRLGVLVRCVSCPPAIAEILLLRDSFGHHYVVEVLTEELEGSEADSSDWRDTVQLHKEQVPMLRYYLFEGMRYIWMARKGAFCRVSVLNEEWTCADLYGYREGLSRREQDSRYVTSVRPAHCSPFSVLGSLQVLNPFYVFQVFSIVLWLADKYYYYAACIFFISLISISVSLYEIRKQSTMLRSMAQLITNVTVRRSSGEEDSVSSVELVPGDCVLIPQEGLLLPCDAVLLAGECMVNESILTGESIPVMKTPLPAAAGRYSAEAQQRHTLFGGTLCIQARGGAIAVVTSTGFYTAKGELISSILYPQPINFRFYQDAMKFLLFLGGVALCGTIYSIVILSRTNIMWWELLIRGLDIVTIVVPPALPAAITTGTIYAQRRLKEQGVYCISPPRINICGKVSMFCFDKTGTLTEEGLDVWGVVEGSGAGFSEIVPDPRFLPQGPMLSALACCHSVALLGGQPLGDPLELKMIESTGWELEEPSGDDKTLDLEFGGHRVLAVMRPPFVVYGASINQAVALVQRFPFSPSLQRMSVVTVAPGGKSSLAFIKGAPEMLASLCQKESVPAQFSNTLHTFVSQGFRVLALGYKPLHGQTDLSSIKREEVERDVQFLGLLVMKNLVKKESAEVIDTLRLAHLRSVMVTGDNILTAVNVAQACGMVGTDERVIFVHATPQTDQSLPSLRFHLGEEGAGAIQGSEDIHSQGLYQGGSKYHLAINGMSFSALCDYFPEYLPKVLMRGTVYARMAPEQKTQLVKELQKLNYRVGMCGDGANDCGALRAADVGVSLSEAEASVASPFTSKSDNISCVPLLIREGRCSLVTSFSLFKYMALYSLIQFTSVLILYTEKTNLGDLQFLFFDMVLVTLLAIVMGKGGPSTELHPQRPPASLLSLPVLASLTLHTLLLILGQVSALVITVSQDWFVPLNSTMSGANNLPNLEDTSVFALSGYQYIIMAVVVTKGYPYKKPLHCLIFIQRGVWYWLVLAPMPFIRKLLKLYVIPDMNFKMLLVALAALNFITCFLLEVLIDHGILNCLYLLRRRKQSKKQYKRLDVLLSESPSWPPLDEPLAPIQCTVIGLS